jgi:hypothetical protein
LLEHKLRIGILVPIGNLIGLAGSSESGDVRSR